MVDGIELELFRHRFAAIAEEMGEVLTLAGFSPSIKERRDHSCAIFDHHGEMVAQAAHIPVHLGSAPLCVKAVREAICLAPGETAIVNDPFAGGTHLPDITLVTAVAAGSAAPPWYVATRAHHADVGGISPGSLPLSMRIEDEGWRCPPARLSDEVLGSLLSESRTPEERRGDIAAQQAANRLGVDRLRDLAATYGAARVVEIGAALQAYSERLTRSMLAELPRGSASVEDVLDDADGGGLAVPLRLDLSTAEGGATLDFSRSADQVVGPMNAVRAIVESAVFYVIRCLVGERAPANSGLMRPIEVITRPGSVVDARYPAAVAAGNVETSQRLVDLILAAFARLVPDQIPACSYGTMNNVLIGSPPGAAVPFVYYETIGGGLGAGPEGPGASAVQGHMTNTLNTPIEALEHAYPIRVRRYAVRRGSGGRGAHSGGDGIVREYELLAPAEITVIAERYRVPPSGAAGGSAGRIGAARLVDPGGCVERLPGKVNRCVPAGFRLVIETPGGGGWGPGSPD